MAWSGIKAGGSAAWQAIEAAWSGLGAWFRGLWAQVVDAAAAAWDAIKAVFATAAEDMREIGRNLIDGLIEGMQERRVDAATVPTTIMLGIIAAAKRAAGVQSPSRVFAEIGRNLMEGLGLGIGSAARGPVRAMTDAVGAITDAGRTGFDGLSADLTVSVQGMDGAVDELRRIGESAGAATDSANSGFERLGRTIGDLITGARSLGDVLREVGTGFANRLGTSGLQGLATAIGGRGGSVVSGFLGSLLGFKDGGSFEVGGVGGMDSQLVAFRATPDERVTITRPGQDMGGGMSGALRVEIVSDSAMFDARVVSIAGPLAVQTARANTRAVLERQRRAGPF